MRLFTRADFDGLVCAAILEELNIVDEITYIHPQDLQDNKIRVTGKDIIANAPFVEGCGLWFDHHCSEHERLQLAGSYTGASDLAPRAAQVVYRYFENKNGYHKKLKKFKELVAVTDIVDSAQFTSTLHKFSIFYFQIIMLLFATHQENPKDPCAQPGWHSW